MIFAARKAIVRYPPSIALYLAIAFAFSVSWATPTIAAQDAPSPWRKVWPKTDFSKTVVPINEITAGGPPRDGIPSIDKPNFIEAMSVDTLSKKEAVVSIEVNEDVRAYPLRFLIWHEIVNDSVGKTPVAITYDPLCNTTIAFERKIAGQTVEFGVTGKLRHSNLIMYDRLSETWWQQFTGEAIIGTHAGQVLKKLPIRLESFEAFLNRHPNGPVLVPNNPNAHPYGRNPYPNYDIADQPYLYKGRLPKGISPLARVAVVRHDNKPVAISLDVLRNKKQMTVGNLQLSWRDGQSSPVSAREIAGGPDVGTVTVLDASSVVENSGAIYEVPFAFAFHAFYPDSKIIKK